MLPCWLDWPAMSALHSGDAKMPGVDSPSELLEKKHSLVWSLVNALPLINLLTMFRLHFWNPNRQFEEWAGLDMGMAMHGIPLQYEEATAHYTALTISNVNIRSPNHQPNIEISNVSCQLSDWCALSSLPCSDSICPYSTGVFPAYPAFFSGSSA